MLWYSAFSLPWPMYSFVAMLNWVTALPLARLRISGSRVRRPVNRTLFTVRVLLLDRPAVAPAVAAFRRERCGGQGRRATTRHGSATRERRRPRRSGHPAGRRTIVVGGPWTFRSAEPADAWRAARP